MAEHIELRREIEALATKIIVEDWSSETGFGKSVQALATAVSGVGESAEAFGYPDVARIAAELSTALNTLGPHDELAQALEHGVAEMQRAFENSSVTASPPEQYSLAQDPELLSDFVLESREHLFKERRWHRYILPFAVPTLFIYFYRPLSPSDAVIFIITVQQMVFSALPPNQLYIFLFYPVLLRTYSLQNQKLIPKIFHNNDIITVFPFFLSISW